MKVGTLEKNITPMKSGQSHPQRNSEHFPNFGAEESPFKDDSITNIPNPWVNRNDNAIGCIPITSSCKINISKTTNI